jgi:hypothetical protein
MVEASGPSAVTYAGCTRRQVSPHVGGVTPSRSLAGWHECLDLLEAMELPTDPIAELNVRG